MTQEPTPSGRTREDFRKKENGNKEETKTESASPNNKVKEAKSLFEDIIERKEFWIFFSGLLVGYILGAGLH